VLSFFSDRQVDLLTLTPQDFVTVVRLALPQPMLASQT
jgi:hypothetical protein